MLKSLDKMISCFEGNDCSLDKNIQEGQVNFNWKVSVLQPKLPVVTGILDGNCKSITDDLSKIAEVVSSVEVRQLEEGKQVEKVHSINDLEKTKALFGFIKDNTERLCKSAFITAPSGDTSISFYNRKNRLISFRVGSNFIGLGWYHKSLNEEKIKVLRTLIQE